MQIHGPSTLESLSLKIRSKHRNVNGNITHRHTHFKVVSTVDGPQATPGGKLPIRAVDISAHLKFVSCHHPMLETRVTQMEASKTQREFLILAKVQYNI